MSALQLAGSWYWRRGLVWVRLPWGPRHWHPDCWAKHVPRSLLFPLQTLLAWGCSGGFPAPVLCITLAREGGACLRQRLLCPSAHSTVSSSTGFSPGLQVMCFGFLAYPGCQLEVALSMWILLSSFRSIQECYE